MIANSDDPQIYENVVFIIDAFEKAALLSGTREGAMVTAQNPLSAMDAMLESSDQVLGLVQGSRKSDKRKKKGAKNNNQLGDDGPLSGLFGKGKKGKNGIGVSYDKDLADILGGGPAAKAIDNYVEECLGCDLRLTFDWQLKPLNLLGGVESLIDGIKDILDAFKIQLEPFKVLDGLCGLLNNLKTLCIPDLIAILLSLKLLIKRYVTDAINIRLDWTVVLGPLLNWILEAVATLIEQIGGIILAPLDCALNVLYTANDLEQEARELAGQIGVLAKGSAEAAKSIAGGGLPPGTTLDTLAEDFTWGGSTLGEDRYPDVPQFGSLRSSTRITNGGKFGLGGVSGGGSAQLSIPTGFRLQKDTRLADALKDPSFSDSTVMEKLILPVQEAKRYIEELMSNIIKSLRSLQALCRGGLGVQMGNIGIIMFLKDMISLVVMIIKMLSSNRNVADWCTYLEENPHLLEEPLRGSFGRQAKGLRVEAGDDHTLIISNGPGSTNGTTGVVREIKTCLNDRTTQEEQLLDQWIKDLKRKGVS